VLRGQRNPSSWPPAASRLVVAGRNKAEAASQLIATDEVKRHQLDGQRRKKERKKERKNERLQRSPLKRLTSRELVFALSHGESRSSQISCLIDRSKLLLLGKKEKESSQHGAVA
jgi:energy-coupling factor transporter ATP-binding protein EcfA2